MILVNDKIFAPPLPAELELFISSETDGARLLERRTYY